jgi:hypothetical protein
MTQWRKEHPHATWAEIEAAVDEQINQLRAQLIQELVQMGETEGTNVSSRCVIIQKKRVAKREQGFANRSSTKIDQRR